MNKKKEISTTIGIIGSGMIGSQVARLSIAAGLNVVICNSRGPETLADLITELGPNARAATLAEVTKSVDLILLAVPFMIYRQLPADLLAGKTLIDTTNYYPERDGIMPEVKTDSISTSELVQAHLRHSFVVRALNNLDFVRLLGRARPAGAIDRSAVPIASDHAQAKSMVDAFLDKIGYDTVDMGALSESWRSEPTMPVYVTPYWGGLDAAADNATFMASPGRVVDKNEVRALLGKAVRHDKMFGSLGNFDENSKRMSTPKIRVGIVGLRADQSWAAVAHLPALRALHEKFEVIGVANSTLRSADAAAKAHGIPCAFENAAALAASADIDLIVVTTRVPQHFDVVKAALNAGKHVYCEWPLGRTLKEAEELAAIARSKSVIAVTGTQARVSPAITKLRQLVAGGYIGEIVSTSMTAYVHTWGPTIGDLDGERYLREHWNGANLLTIPFGHTVAAIRDVLGDITRLSSVLETRYKQVLVAGTETHIAADTPDHILVSGLLANGAPLSIFYAGGSPPASDGFVWDIQGTAGNLRVTGANGYSQIADLIIIGRNDNSTTMTEILPDPDSFQALNLVSGNVARIYQRMADDIHHHTQTAPTFADAVGLHRILEAVEQSASQGVHVEVDAPNRMLT